MSESLQPHGPQQDRQSLTISGSLPKFVSVESVLQSNHLILCLLLLLLPSVFNQCVSLSSLWYQEARVPSPIQGRGYDADAICTILKTWFLTSCTFLSALSVSPFLKNLSRWTCEHVDGSALLKKDALPSPILSSNLASDSLTAKHPKRVIYSHCFQFFTSDSFSNSLHHGFSSHYSTAKDCDKVSNTQMPYNLTYVPQPLTFAFLAIFSVLLDSLHLALIFYLSHGFSPKSPLLVEKKCLSLVISVVSVVNAIFSKIILEIMWSISMDWNVTCILMMMMRYMPISTYLDLNLDIHIFFPSGSLYCKF